MAILRISRVVGERRPCEIAKLKLCDHEWDRLRCRMTPQQPWVCRLDLLDDRGRDRLYAPIGISAVQTDHLLRDVFMMKG